MKLKAYTVILSTFLCCTTVLCQRGDGENRVENTQFGMFLNVDSPFKSVMPQMSTSGLYGLSLAHNPIFGSPVFIEFKAAWGNYAREFYTDQNFEINGWLYPADVTYKSGYQKYLLGSKIMVGREFRKIRGFATPQIGLLRMRSRTSVTYYDGTVNWSDENDDGSENAFRTAVKQTGWVFGAEAGMEISIQRLIKPDTDKNTFRLLISGSYLGGFSKYIYADVDEMINASQLPDDAAALTKYVQMSHPQIWEDKYTKLIESALQMWGINVGLTINF